jgi:mannose-6-phosphate isomerase-like protein (cupin superfamily)
MPNHLDRNKVQKKENKMPEPIRHGNYIMEITTGMSGYKQIEYPNWGVAGGRDLSGANFSVGTSYLTKPFVMVEETHSHDFDQILFFLGGDPKNVKDFDGEVEMTLGDKKEIITYASCVYIPKGLMHCPLNIKKVNKPITFIDVTLAPIHSMRPMPKTSKKD